MFKVGDKIFYPMHGGGVIEAIEEKEILGEKHEYYIISLLLNDMQVMIPTQKIAEIGIRQVSEPEQLDNMLENFKPEEPDTSINPNKRHQLNTKKMKTGNISEVMQVVCDLVSLSQNKRLGTGDKMMLDNAKQFLVSELILVKEIAEEKANDLLNQSLDQYQH